MKKYFIAFFMCCLFLFFSISLFFCTTNPYDKQTKLFDKYLCANVNQCIPWEPHHYLIIPLEGCSLCIEGILEKLNNEDIDKLRNFTLIISYSGKIAPFDLQTIPNKKNVIIDNTGYLLRIQLAAASPAFISTAEKKITTIFHYRNDNLNSLFTQLHSLPKL